MYNIFSSVLQKLDTTSNTIKVKIVGCAHFFFNEVTELSTQLLLTPTRTLLKVSTNSSINVVDGFRQLSLILWTYFKITNEQSMSMITFHSHTSGIKFCLWAVLYLDLELYFLCW